MNRIQTYGFESAIPIGRWTLAFDISERVFPQSLGPYDVWIRYQNWRVLENAVRARGGTPIPSPDTRSASEASYIARQALIDYAINENEGTFVYKETLRIWALEFTADLDKWVYGLGLLGGQFEIRDEKSKKLVELHERLESLAGSMDRGIDDAPGVFPFINVGRYLSEDKKDIIGMSLGVFGSVGGGLLIYFGQEYYESLQVGLALEILSLASDEETFEVLEGYDLKEEGAASLRWVFGYKF